MAEKEYPVANPPEKKRKKEPSPYREYHRKEELKVPFLRVGYFDGWEQLWVVEGRVRTMSTGRVSRKWTPVGYLSERTEWFDDRLMSQFFVDTVPDMRREIASYKKRSKEWLDKGGSLRDLNIRMAIENGTWKEE